LGEFGLAWCRKDIEQQDSQTQTKKINSNAMQKLPEERSVSS
jgi:hypothetical protein